jgi:Carbohydrate binding module (family 6)
LIRLIEQLIGPAVWGGKTGMMNFFGGRPRLPAWGATLVIVGVGASLAALGGCQKDEGETDMVAPGDSGGSMLADGTIDGGPDGAGGSDRADAGGGGTDGGRSDMMVMGGIDAAVEAAPEAPISPPPDAGAELPPLVGYKGTAWNNMPQAVPGMIRASFYDVGGEGVAYHDLDTGNNGANQARLTDPNLPEASFRAAEGVDMRTTRNGMDHYDNGTNLQAGQLYIGWTQSGEWVNYTIDVKESAQYAIAALVATLTEGTRVTFALEDGTNTGPRAMPWTHSYMAWHFADNIGSLDITAGLHVLTMRFETPGVNVEYLSLTKN